VVFYSVYFCQKALNICLTPELCLSRDAKKFCGLAADIFDFERGVLWQSRYATSQTKFHGCTNHRKSKGKERKCGIAMRCCSADSSQAQNAEDERIAIALDEITAEGGIEVEK
jgi:hypothetical protein